MTWRPSSLLTTQSVSDLRPSSVPAINKAIMTVFVLRDDQTLVPLEPAEFATEDDFQLLLAKFPSLLSWEQNDAGCPDGGCCSNGKGRFPQRTAAAVDGRSTTFSLIKTAYPRRSK
jgi:hypothetical protein